MGLGKAWEFLGGAERNFEFSLEQKTALAFTEYSYFMPLEVAQENRTGGIGVLIQRADAVAVATHMFGLPEDELQEADLKDACSEVCNVFSDSIALHISGSSDVSIGLPFLATQAEYDKIATESTALAVYVSPTPHAQLFVVVYHFFSQPS